MIKLQLLVGIYFFTCLIFALFSYIFTDPNLVMSSNTTYWQFQQWLWSELLPKSELLKTTYFILICILFVTYLMLIKVVKSLKLSTRALFLITALISLPMIFSYNALSHDLFNYMFNAKMIVVYQSNPHINSAINFISDPWTRFMHNVHTPAPYGYGWTAISIIPYFFGFGKFLITWLNFKLFALLSFFLTSCFLFTILKKADDRNSKLLLFTLNPLILIEVLGNGHNDLWMMVPALISYIFLEKYTNEKIKYQKNIFLAGCLIAISLSIFIKYSTLIILPLIIIMLLPSVVKNLRKHKYYFWLKKHFAEIAAILLLLPLLTDRSQQFHPWYLLWSLAWLPIINNRIIRIVLLSFSLSSILRYIPWIESGFQYNLEIVHNQKLITWVGGVLIFVILKFTSSNYANLALKKVLK